MCLCSLKEVVQENFPTLKSSLNFVHSSEIQHAIANIVCRCAKLQNICNSLPGFKCSYDLQIVGVGSKVFHNPNGQIPIVISSEGGGVTVCLAKSTVTNQRILKRGLKCLSLDKTLPIHLHKEILIQCFFLSLKQCLGISTTWINHVSRLGIEHTLSHGICFFL